MKIYYYFILIIVNSYFALQLKEGEELIHIFTFISNGISSPTNSFNSNHQDPFNEFWKIEEGELANSGERQAYILGYLTQKNYIEFFSNIKKKDIDILTTHTNSTIESAYSYLNGLFPHRTGKIINEDQIKNNLDIPPININMIIQERSNLNLFTLPKNANSFGVKLFDYKQKYISLFQNENCLGVETYINENNFSQKLLDEIKLFNSKHKEKLKSSIQVNEITDQTLLLLTDIFHSDFSDTRTFNVLSEYYKTEEELKELKNDFYSLASIKSLDLLFRDKSNQSRISRIGVSKISREIIKEFNNALNNKNKKKIIIYSVSEGDLAIILNFLSHAFNTKIDYDNYFPDFTSTISFILVKGSNNNVTVRISKDFDTILSSGLDEFIELINRASFSDKEIEAFCNPSNYSDSNLKNTFVYIIIGLSVLNVIGVIVIIMWYKTKMDFMEVIFDEENNNSMI